MDNIISVRSVSKNFKENVAIKNLTFNVKEGEIFGFLGPSGAGKTTTIKLLTSQLIPSGGDAMVFDKHAYLQKKEVFKQIGVLTDNSGIYERLSVKDNLSLFAEINEVPKENIAHVLDKVGLLPYQNKEAKKLSRGMKQRLMLARAVLHKPKLLFLDEPTSALDPGTTLEIHRLLRQLNEEGTTIFLTTHNMEEADKLCHRVAFLNEGEIVEMGEPQKLKLKYTNNNIKVILKDDNHVVIKNDKEGAAKINYWMARGDLAAVHSMEPNLEEIFLRLTGREL
ncbi:ABC transporter ATP-binding protein [Alkalicella caledoniensis]|uniref:ABC transporter ATP-binding protein n=1 Tax=Alkalicella caledoniensis TaxID=2731377 RepID=A0A7G9W9L4_ALKCA|nr:ABC transporter ATP-binding protein [Alkalicella caledoniensis]QNO15376.1 ABC transporter ATP-binding protein [Alkalicella caledoniensis]